LLSDRRQGCTSTYRKWPTWMHEWRPPVMLLSLPMQAMLLSSQNDRVLACILLCLSSLMLASYVRTPKSSHTKRCSDFRSSFMLRSVWGALDFRCVGAGVCRQRSTVCIRSVAKQRCFSARCVPHRRCFSACRLTLRSRIPCSAGTAAVHSDLCGHTLNIATLAECGKSYQVAQGN
jgi:hypothetical protein